MINIDNIKNALGITGDYQDDTIQEWIDEVVGFLKDAGVSEKNITNGIVARGVSDLWHYGEGDGKLSTYFIMRASQLAIRSQTCATIQRPSTPSKPSTPDKPDEPTPDEPSEPALPSGYVKLDHVVAEPTVGATVYLDTGVIPTVDTGAEYTVEPSVIALNGSHTLSSSSVFMCTLQRAGILFNRFGNTAVLPDAPKVGTKYRISSFVNSNIARINEYSVPVNAGGQTSNALILGCFGGAIADSTYWFSGKIYELKIYEGSELIKDFVPAQRASDDKVGFYERIGGAFYSSSGTGDYKVGVKL